MASQRFRQTQEFEWTRETCDFLRKPKTLPSNIHRPKISAATEKELPRVNYSEPSCTQRLAPQIAPCLPMNEVSNIFLPCSCTKKGEKSRKKLVMKMITISLSRRKYWAIKTVYYWRFCANPKYLCLINKVMRGGRHRAFRWQKFQ